jgi:DNA-directed RNA polymerase
MIRRLVRGVMRHSTTKTASIYPASSDEYKLNSPVHTSIKYLANLKSSNLEKSIDTFQQFSLFDQNPNIISAQISKVLNCNQNEARTIYNALKSTYDFMEQSDAGLLMMDLNVDSIHYINRQLEQGEHPDKILTDLFEKMDINIFKLPVKGIPHPEFENPKNLFMRQLSLEKVTSEIVKEEKMTAQEALTRMSIVNASGFLHSLITKNFSSFLKLIVDEQQRCQTVMSTNNINDIGKHELYVTYLTKFEPDQLALIAVIAFARCFSRAAATYFPKIELVDEQGVEGFAIIKIYEIVNEICELMTDTKVFKKMYTSSLERLKQNNKAKEQADSEATETNEAPQVKNDAPIKLNNTIRRIISDRVKNIMKKSASSVGDEDSTPYAIKVQISTVLIYFLQLTLKFQYNGSSQSLIRISTTKVRQKKTGVVTIHPQAIVEYLKNISSETNNFAHLERALPLIYPPAKWKNSHVGGYYLQPTSLFKLFPYAKQTFVASNKDLSESFKIVDYISNMPWKINGYILDVVEKLWDKGGGVCMIPERYLKDDDGHLKSIKILLESTSDRKIKIKAKEELQTIYEHLGLRCDFLLKLQVARSFKNIGKFYYPHNMDFRGRVYPLPPHLNHMSSDICRGLLTFARSKPIGKNGLRWLKIHLTNKIGNDKISLDDRAAYAESLMPMVERCVADPVNNREWMEYEDCWQTLAAMHELVNALRTPNPEDYCSSLPIHQDGTCNGLQHYAALGRDLEGAKEVNLVNNIKPGDLYTLVANKVEKKLKEDVVNATSKNHKIAMQISFGIKRKIVKQTVMTTVYGVTYYGAKKQIRKQLKEIMNEDEEALNEASKYIATLTLEAVKDIFGQAHEIKNWLKSIARISVEVDEPVSWFTPLGIPIIQPYRIFSIGKAKIDTMLQMVDIYNEDEESAKIDKGRQTTAFPPNFVHSLDSSHMMFTAKRMAQQGLDFAAVHDSYWTHAQDVDFMSVSLREEFVRLHKMPLLENLKESMERRFIGFDIPDVPKKGALDLNNVLGSTYFFS